MRDITSTQLVKEMHLGWNLGNTLDAHAKDVTGLEVETCWGNPKTTQAMIDRLIEDGIDVFRIPVTWRNHFKEEEGYPIDPVWMARVKEVVDYAYNRGKFVILNLHHEHWDFPSEENKPEALRRVKALWTQIGTNFADYDEKLIFECLNETRKIGTPVEWNEGDEEGRRVIRSYMEEFVKTVRGLSGNNPKRHLMVSGYATACAYDSLKEVYVPEKDDKIIATVHAYIPYDFALRIGEGERKEWNHDTAAIDDMMKNLEELFINKGTPVIIGEFGAMSRDNEEDRCEWVDYYVSAAKKIGAPCLWWDNNSFYGEGELLGLFKREDLTFPFPKLYQAFLKAGLK